MRDRVQAMSTRARVEAAFAENTHEFGDRYLELLHASWTAIEAALKRTTFLIVSLLAAFLLLQEADSGDFSLGPVAVTDASSVLILVPAVVSVLYYEFVVLLFARDRYWRLQYELIRKLYPSVHDAGLGHALAPPTASVWGANPWQQLRTTGWDRATHLLDNSGFLVAGVLVLAAIFFPIYAYVWLFADSDANDILVAASLIFGMFNLVRTGLTFWDESRATNEPAITARDDH